MHIHGTRYLATSGLISPDMSHKVRLRWHFTYLKLKKNWPVCYTEMQRCVQWCRNASQDKHWHRTDTDTDAGDHHTFHTAMSNAKSNKWQLYTATLYLVNRFAANDKCLFNPATDFLWRQELNDFSKWTSNMNVVTRQSTTLPPTQEISINSNKDYNNNKFAHSYVARGLHCCAC